jgi:hypothetical protein
MLERGLDQLADITRVWPGGGGGAGHQFNNASACFFQLVLSVCLTHPVQKITVTKAVNATCQQLALHVAETQYCSHYSVRSPCQQPAAAARHRHWASAISEGP